MHGVSLMAHSTSCPCVCIVVANAYVMYVQDEILRPHLLKLLAAQSPSQICQQWVCVWVDKAFECPLAFRQQLTNVEPVAGTEQGQALLVAHSALEGAIHPLNQQLHALNIQTRQHQGSPVATHHIVTILLHHFHSCLMLQQLRSRAVIVDRLQFDSICPCLVCNSGNHDMLIAWPREGQEGYKGERGGWWMGEELAALSNVGQTFQAPDSRPVLPHSSSVMARQERVVGPLNGRKSPCCSLVMPAESPSCQPGCWDEGIREVQLPA